MTRPAILVLVSTLVLPGQPTAAPVRAVLELRIVWKGPLPATRPVRLPPGFAERHPEQAEFCGRCALKGELVDESLVVDPGNRGVRDVAVSLRGVKEAARPLPAATLDNRGCRFDPHVQFIPAGRPLAVKNSDAFTHNAHIVGRGRQHLWNGLVGPGRTARTPPILVSGIYTVLCDVHPWMKATVIVVKHSWCGVTGADGRLRLEELPPGRDRRFVLWHETLGVARLKLDLDPGGTVKRRLTQKDFRK